MDGYQNVLAAGRSPSHGQQGQTGLHVTTVVIPAKQGLDRERMSEVVNTGPSQGPPGHQPNLSDQFMEGRVDGVVDQPVPRRWRRSAHSSDFGHPFRLKADAVPAESGQARGRAGAMVVFGCQVAQPMGQAT